MSEFSKMIIESIMASKPVDTSKIFEEMIAERISEVLPSVMHSMSESVLGPKDPNDEEEDFPEIDFDEMSDEDFAELLDNLSDEDLEDLADQLGDLDESELMEISKSTLGSYLTKATKNYGENRYAQGGLNQRANLKSGKDRDAAIDQADRNGAQAEKRQRGIGMAAKKLAKEDVDMELENILDQMSDEEFETFILDTINDLDDDSELNESLDYLDEISKGRLKDYISAAKDSKNYHDLTSIRHANMVSDFKNPESKKNLTKSSLQHFGKVVKRSVGINKATNKLAKKDD